MDAPRLEGECPHIAMLDAAGRVVAVNRAWELHAQRRAADAQAATVLALDFRRACSAGGLAAHPATQAPAGPTCAGISAVLDGRDEHFELEYVSTCPPGGSDDRRWFRLHVSPLAGGGAVLTHEDISRRKAAEAQIHNLAFYDPLTGLPNRRMLVDRLQQASATSARHGHHGAVFFIDLDHFKTLNDTLGHDHGDLLLQEVARRLLGCVRAEDTVARFGGDEFVVMSTGLSAEAGNAATQAAVVGEKILAAICQPAQLGLHTHAPTPSVGVCLFRGHELALEEVIRRADLAMYQAKAAGRGTVRFFDPVMQAGQAARAAMDQDLRRAVASGQLCLHYQSLVDAQRGIVGAEALLRWQHPQRGLLLPEQFLALAEQNGLIVPIGHWVMDTVCAQLGQWAKQGRLAGLHLAVNVSARQFREEGFIDGVAQALRRHGADPRCLRLELRESLLQDNPARTLMRMAALKALGVGFVLDDFGISYSSLSVLKRLPLDQIKISQTLMRTLVSDPHDAAIVRTIVGIAQGLDVGASAAGVDTPQQRELLRELGCLQWQGDCFGAPTPLRQFELQLAAAGMGPA